MIVSYSARGFSLLQVPASQKVSLLHLARVDAKIEQPGIVDEDANDEVQFLILPNY